MIRRIGWCTGGGQGYIDTAIAAGVDLYLTGEASEQTFHSARENGISFIAAGHHATERYGVQALGTTWRGVSPSNTCSSTAPIPSRKPPRNAHSGRYKARSFRSVGP